MNYENDIKFLINSKKNICKSMCFIFDFQSGHGILETCLDFNYKRGKLKH